MIFYVMQGQDLKIIRCIGGAKFVNGFCSDLLFGFVLFGLLFYLLVYGVPFYYLFPIFGYP